MAIELRKLCEWKKCEIYELSMKPDHIHIIIDIPPKNSVSEILGILKEKQIPYELGFIPKVTKIKYGMSAKYKDFHVKFVPIKHVDIIL
jgi:REP element-mobilizing transposase RayT